MVLSQVAPGQSSGRITGTVIDKTTGLPVPMASIVIDQAAGTVSDKEGKFIFTGIKAGKHTYEVHFLGYESVKGEIAVEKDIKNLIIEISPLSIGLQTVVVTAVSTPMGSTSRIGQTAIQHIQPKSVEELLQLLPGNLSQNPDLNKLAQATLREIGPQGKLSSSTANSAMGTAIILDGAPVSNDANMQTLSPTLSGTRSNLSMNGMADQTTAGRGVDMRLFSPDNVEYMEVIRGIPSSEYGNLTSGVVIVKTKTGATPWELKFKTDPFSKMAYAGKGFVLSGGGAVNASLDWSQSFGDTRKRYLGYDRITASLGYSDLYELAGKPMTFNVRGTFFSNINNSKNDPQMAMFNDTYKNNSTGGRINIEGEWKLNTDVISCLSYCLMGSVAHQKDELHTYIPSPPGAITTSHEAGLNEGMILNRAYYTDYVIDGIPLNTYFLLKANKNIDFGQASHTSIKAGLDWRYDANAGRGLVFDEQTPPTNTGSQSLRPRSFKDIPAMNNLSLFVEDKLYLTFGTRSATVQAGVRFTNLFLDRRLAKQGNMMMAEPRINAEIELLNSRNNTIIDRLALTAGWGVAHKAPTLLYLYPNDAYFDMAAVSRFSQTDPTATIAVFNTDVVRNPANPDLKPARSEKIEAGISFRKGRVSGFVTFFNERYTNEFGFASVPHYMDVTRYSVPDGSNSYAFDGDDLFYKDTGGDTHLAATTTETLFQLYYVPTNNMRSEKRGIEYSLDFGQIRPLRTSIIVDGAWFSVKRTNTLPRYSMMTGNYPYMPLLPAGEGSEQNRVNTNVRLITHIPALKLVFSTTVQVVWYEGYRRTWRDSDGNDLNFIPSGLEKNYVVPMGYYDKSQTFHSWQPGLENDPAYVNMVSTSMSSYYDKDVVKPWVMLNFRLTKEIGRMLDFSFVANNFTNSSKWHSYLNDSGYRQIYPPIYFGAELRIRINAN